MTHSVLERFEDNELTPHVIPDLIWVQLDAGFCWHDGIRWRIMFSFKNTQMDMISEDDER